MEFSYAQQHHRPPSNGYGYPQKGFVCLESHHQIKDTCSQISHIHSCREYL